MPTRPRIEDVAREAGVSKTAVSFAFNQPENLSSATRERILAVATEIGYRPSPLARRLAARRTDQIGLVVPQSTHDIFANPFLAELVRGLGDECDEQGIAIVIVPPVGGSIARSIEAALVDGLILLGLDADHPELELFRRGQLPVVALDVERWDGASVIATDDEEGARHAAVHLRELGHRDVAVVLIARHPDTPADERGGMSARRLRGVREGLGLRPSREHGEAVGDAPGSGIRLRVLTAPVSEEGGRAAFAELADELPTAVLTMSDVVAIGLLNAALDAGVDVPERLSIIGFDDVPAASWTSPRLTTVHQPIREKGRLAARRLIDSIRSGGGSPGATDRLATRLVVRGSTAIAPTAPVVDPDAAPEAP